MAFRGGHLGCVLETGCSWVFKIDCMSFRASSLGGDKIRIEDNQLPSQLLVSSMHPLDTQDPNQSIIRKISATIVALHEGYLAKCRNIEIYRDLSEEEQTLLLTVDKNTSIHTALAGILAIDSCVKCIDKEEAFILGNMIRGAGAAIAQFRALQCHLTRVDSACRESSNRLADALRYLIQQMYCIPAARGREDDQERQLTLLDKDVAEINEEQLEEDYQRLLGELQKENDLLKVGLREKESYIALLESRCERGQSKFDKLEQKRTAHSLGFRMSTEKSSENGSSSQHLYEEISHLKEQLLEKNNIVIKMNEQFASEMEKYNSVFKRLQDENRQMKRYIDVDTAYLLQELQYEVEMLREEKRKDQMIISDIQRKIEGISLARTSRINTRHGYDFNNRQPFDYSPEPLPHYEQRPPYDNRYSKFYSPNYAPRLSPYSRPPKEEIPYCHPDFRASNHPGISRKLRIPQGNMRFAETMRRDEMRMDNGQSYTRKSRNVMNHSKQSREVMENRPSPSFNLLERVMSKKM